MTQERGVWWLMVVQYLHDGVFRDFYRKKEGNGVKVFDQDLREWLLSRLLFADETALEVESPEQLQRLIISLEWYSKEGN